MKQFLHRARNRRIVLLLLGVIVLVAVGIFVFRVALRPGQQQRVINILPVMENFLSRTPNDLTLPTPPPSNSAVAPEDLLSMPLFEPASTVELESTLEVEPALTETSVPASGS